MSWAGWGFGDLVDELAGDGFAEGAELVDFDDEAAGTADDVVAVPLGEAARGLDVGEGVADGVVVDDGEAVDGDACLQRVVAGGGAVAAGIVGGGARAGGDAAGGRARHVTEHGHGVVDAGADAGPAVEGAGGFGDDFGHGLGAGGVANDRPVHDGLDLVGSGELDVGDGNGAGGAVVDGGEDAGVLEGGGVALFLQVELAVVDAAGHVADEDKGEVDRFGGAGDGWKEQEKEEGGAHQTPPRGERHRDAGWTRGEGITGLPR